MTKLGDSDFFRRCKILFLEQFFEFVFSLVVATFIFDWNRCFRRPNELDKLLQTKILQRLKKIEIVQLCHFWLILNFVFPTFVSCSSTILHQKLCGEASKIAWAKEHLPHLVSTV